MKNSQRKKKIMKVTVVIGALIIPLLYSLLYLGAFWDPYAKLDQLSVAVVNLDKGAVINGDSRNLGEEVCRELRNDGTLKFQFTDRKTAEKGLKGHRYYATITIPENFSQKISTAGMEHKEIAEIRYAANEKRNYLAAQILNSAIQKIDGEVTANLTKELIGTLAEKLREIPQTLEKLDEGLAALKEGSQALKEGTGRLLSGADKLSDGTGKLSGGTTELTGGILRLTKGSEDLDRGLGQLEEGIQAINGNGDKLNQLRGGLQELKNGTDQLSVGLSQMKEKIDGGLEAYQQKVNSYIEGYQALFQLTEGSGVLATLPEEQQAKLKALNDGAPTMAPGYTAMMAQIDGAMDGAIAGAQKVNAGATELNEGAENLDALQKSLLSLEDGVHNLRGGSGRLESGMHTLSANAAPLQKGAVEVDRGTRELQGGFARLDGGTEALDRGIFGGKAQIDEKLEFAKNEGKKLDEISEYAADPLKITKGEVGYVPNYGTAFAPYFLSLSLWVGGLIIFFGIYLDVDKRYKYLCRDSQNKVIRSFAYLALGVAQALVLGLVIKFALGLQVTNLFLYLVSCILVSMVFISIIQLCLVHLGDMGKFVVLLLLILQLTSCGGTFPMETVPKFFNLLYPFMPMTYSVDLFKDVITGDVDGSRVKTLAVLISVMVLAMAATILLSVMKKSVRELRKAKRQGRRQPFLQE